MITVRALRPRSGRFMAKRSRGSARCRPWSNGTPTFRRLKYCSKKRRRPPSCSSAQKTELIVPTLHELQRSLRRSIIERENAEAAAQVIGDGLDPAERLGIYRNTLISSLTTALRLCYPAIHRLVGADFFDSVAQLYVEQQPPHSAYLDDYGGEVPDFLARFPPAASLCYLPDVARLEWAVNRALHAVDAQPLDLELLAEVEPVNHGRVRFVPHP